MAPFSYGEDAPSGWSPKSDNGCTRTAPGAKSAYDHQQFYRWFRAATTGCAVRTGCCARGRAEEVRAGGVYDRRDPVDAAVADRIAVGEARSTGQLGV